jgi:hypothetical protein
VEETPEENESRNQNQAEGLITAIETALGFARLLLGELLKMRLDAGFNHDLSRTQNSE